MKNYESRLLSMIWKNSGISKAGFDQSFLRDRALRSCDYRSCAPIVRLKIVRPSPDSDLSILLYKGFYYQVYCSVQSARSMTFQWSRSRSRSLVSVRSYKIDRQLKMIAIEPFLKTESKFTKYWMITKLKHRDILFAIDQIWTICPSSKNSMII